MLLWARRLHIWVDIHQRPVPIVWAIVCVNLSAPGCLQSTKSTVSVFHIRLSSWIPGSLDGWHGIQASGLWAQFGHQGLVLENGMRRSPELGYLMALILHRNKYAYLSKICQVTHQSQSSSDFILRYTGLPLLCSMFSSAIRKMVSTSSVQLDRLQSEDPSVIGMKKSGKMRGTRGILKMMHVCHFFSRPLAFYHVTATAECLVTCIIPLFPVLFSLLPCFYGSRLIWVFWHYILRWKAPDNRHPAYSHSKRISWPTFQPEHKFADGLHTRHAYDFWLKSTGKCIDYMHLENVRVFFFLSEYVVPLSGSLA